MSYEPATIEPLSATNPGNPEPLGLIAIVAAAIYVVVAHAAVIVFSVAAVVAVLTASTVEISKLPSGGGGSDWGMKPMP